MYQQFYQGSHLLGFAVFALVLFMLLFATMVTVAWRGSRRSGEQDALSHLPLAEDDGRSRAANAHTAPAGEPSHV